MIDSRGVCSFDMSVSSNKNIGSSICLSCTFDSITVFSNQRSVLIYFELTMRVHKDSTAICAADRYLGNMQKCGSFIGAFEGENMVSSARTILCNTSTIILTCIRDRYLSTVGNLEHGNLSI